MITGRFLKNKNKGFKLCVSFYWKRVSCLKNQSYWFLMNYIRKNAKYFACKFYKKKLSFEVDLFEEQYFVNVAFPASIVKERLVSLNVIDKTDNPTDAFSHISGYSVFVRRLPVLKDFCTFGK